MHRHVVDVTAEDASAAGSWIDQTHQELQRRSLASAVGAEEAEDLAELNRQ